MTQAVDSAGTDASSFPPELLLVGVALLGATIVPVLHATKYQLLPCDCVVGWQDTCERCPVAAVLAQCTVSRQEATVTEFFMATCHQAIPSA